jgi:hypothetical protein
MKRFTYESDEQGTAGEPCENWLIRDTSTDNNDIVAIVPKTGDEDYDNEHTYPTAKLFAAAPELLAVLQQAHKTLTDRCMEDGSMDWVSPGQTLLERIANAIEDATGTRPEEF